MFNIKKVSLLLGLASSAVIVGAASAQAESLVPQLTHSSAVPALPSQPEQATGQSPAPAMTQSGVTTIAATGNNPSGGAPAATVAAPAVATPQPSAVALMDRAVDAVNAPQPGAIASITTPTPGTSVTTAAALTPDANASQPAVAADSASSQPALIAQDVTPGRATRGVSSYFGVGGNIGIINGDTRVGEGSFALLSKIGLLPAISARPSILFTGDVSILLPITYDLQIGALGETGYAFAPFIGLGPAFSTGDGSNVDLVVTGGIDVPISAQFTATGSVNATVTGDPSLGILLGIGYNFSGF